MPNKQSITPMARSIKKSWTRIKISHKIFNPKTVKAIKQSRKNAYFHMRTWELEGLTRENYRAKLDMLQYLELMAREVELDVIPRPRLGWAESFTIGLQRALISKLYEEYFASSDESKKNSVKETVSYYEHEVERLENSIPVASGSRYFDPHYNIQMSWTY